MIENELVSLDLQKQINSEQSENHPPIWRKTRLQVINEMATVKDTALCDPCNRQQKQETATHWCRTCKENFCNECKNVHKNTKMSFNHIIMPVQEITEDDIMLSRLTGLFCCKHKDEPASFYCVEDEQAFCALCTISAHKNCHEVLYTTNIEKNCVMKSTKRTSKVDDIVEQAFTGDKSSESKYENEIDSIIENIDEVIRKCTAHMNMLGKKMKHLLNERKAMEKDSYEKRRKNITQFKTCLHSQIKIAKLCSKMSDSQAISAKFNMKDKLSTEYKTLQNVFDGATEKHLTFEPNVLLSQLQALAVIGDIKEDTTPSIPAKEVASINQHINRLPNGLLPAPQAQVALNSTKPLMEGTPTLKKVFSKKDIGIGDAQLYGSAYLPDGQLVVTDYNRDKLLLFDANITLQAQYEVLRSPCGVCASADGALIYVMHEDGTLVTYRLRVGLVKMFGGGLQEVSRVAVQESTTGVGMSGDTIITGHDDKITLYNKKGEKLSSISKTGHYTIICVSQDGTKFYQRDGNCIVCRNVSDLADVFRYSHPELRDPHGIACDRHGNIMVTGYKYGNIIIINQDGTTSKVLLNKLHHIEHPAAVCCHSQHDEFVVTSCRVDTAMEVYEIK